MLNGNTAALFDTQVGWMTNENTGSFISKWLPVCSLSCYAATFTFKQKQPTDDFSLSAAAQQYLCIRAHTLSFPLSIKQNQHQTESTPMCGKKKKKDLKTVFFFWCFQLGADSVMWWSIQIECEWRLISVSQYMQMAARQSSLVVIIHVQDLWLSEHCAVYAGFQKKSPSVMTSGGAFLAVGQM